MGAETWGSLIANPFARELTAACRESRRASGSSDDIAGGIPMQLANPCPKGLAAGKGFRVQPL